MTEQQTAELATMLLSVLHGYDENAIFDALALVVIGQCVKAAEGDQGEAVCHALEFATNLVNSIQTADVKVPA